MKLYLLIKKKKKIERMKKYALNPKALEDQGTLRENLMLQMKDELRPNQTKP